MTRTARRPDSAGVRSLLAVGAVTATLVAWVSLAHVAPVDEPPTAPATTTTTVEPMPSAEAVDVSPAVDVTASASGRSRGRR